MIARSELSPRVEGRSSDHVRSQMGEGIMGKKLPRTLVTKRLRWMKDRTQYMLNCWTPTGTVYLDPSEREAWLAAHPGSKSTWHRPREAHEYPENQTAAWESLAAYCEAIAGEAGALAQYARQQRDMLVMREDEKS